METANIASSGGVDSFSQDVSTAEAQLDGHTNQISKDMLEGVAKQLHDVSSKTSQTNAAALIKELVLPDHPRQQQNKILIASTEGVLEGLVKVVSTGSQVGKFQACNALAQLAWGNESNSARIPLVEGLVHGLATILGDGDEVHYLAQEQAAITVGNCAANSREASEIFAGHDVLLDSFARLVRESSNLRLRETVILAIKNCAASSQDAALQIASHRPLLSAVKDLAVAQGSAGAGIRSMCIGAINSFSRSPGAVALLNAVAVVPDVLFPALREIGDGGHGQLLNLTITSALANMVAGGEHNKMIEEWVSCTQGEEAVANLVKCLSLALSDCRWDQVSFSPHSVMYPLFNIAQSCPASLAIMRKHDIIPRLAALLQNFHKYPHPLQTLELGVLCVGIIVSEGEASMRLVRARGLIQILVKVSSTISSFPGVKSEADKARILKIQKSAAESVGRLVESPIALCMGMHSSLGRRSLFQRLDRDMLELIASYAFCNDS